MDPDVVEKLLARKEKKFVESGEYVRNVKKIGRCTMSSVSVGVSRNQKGEKKCAESQESVSLESGLSLVRVLAHVNLVRKELW